MRVKSLAVRDTVRTKENETSPERGAWTPLLSGADGLVVTESGSCRRGVLGRRQADTHDVNNGGHHEQ